MGPGDSPTTAPVADGQIIRTTAADGGSGKCLAATLEPSPNVCNVTIGAALQVCDCGNQADCDYHRHCPKAMEFLATAASSSKSMQLASSLNPTLCLTAAPLPHADGINITLQIWSKPLANGDFAAVAFNRGTFTTTAKMEWQMLGLPGGDSSVWTARDLWANRSLGSFANGFKATVAPHDVVMVVLTPNRQ